MSTPGWLFGAALFVFNACAALADFLATDSFFVWRVVALCAVGYVLVKHWGVWK